MSKHTSEVIRETVIRPEFAGGTSTLVQASLFAMPEETRFASFQDLYQEASEQRSRCFEVPAARKDFLFRAGESQETDLLSIEHWDLKLTNYAYRQIATQCGVKLETMARLKQSTRLQVLNELWRKAEGYETLTLLAEAHQGQEKVRCITSQRYARLWDQEVLAEVDRWLLSSGWTPAYPTINLGELETLAPEDRPKALARDDRSMFAFFFTPKGATPGSDDLGGLRRGLCVWNSEVGHKSFAWATFVFRDVCRNFLVWGMEQGVQKRARHVGVVRDAFRDFRQDAMELSGALTTFELDSLHRAARTPFVKRPEASEGGSVDERWQSAVAKRLNARHGVSRPAAARAAELALDPTQGAGDFSIWSVVNGLTAAARDLKREEDRFELVEKAGKVLKAELASR